MEIKERIPLRISDDRLILTVIAECPKLRIPKSLVEFVVDTGSPNSFISHSDVKNMQIPVMGKKVEGEIDFGGSRFKYFSPPKFNIYVLKGEGKDYTKFKVSLQALKTTKTSKKKIEIAHNLPSIIGINFLREQKFSLHVILTEELAYLQYEG